MRLFVMAALTAIGLGLAAWLQRQTLLQPRST